MAVRAPVVEVIYTKRITHREAGNPFFVNLKIHIAYVLSL